MGRHGGHPSLKRTLTLEGCGPISANLFVANLTQILYKYGACLEAMQPTRTGIYCYRFFHRIG